MPDPRSLARAATLIENRQAADLLQTLFPQTGRAITIGITGPPGAGKSTLIDRFIRSLRAQNKKVAVLAVDPTSPFTGGAILGDRVRMQSHHADPGVFIRSLATRGRLGGLSAATSDLAIFLDASGFDVVLIETVGVGQAEIDITHVADVTAVVLVPGQGDDVQSIKAGILEIADVYVLNKADQPGIDQLEQHIRAQLSLAPRADHWTPPIIRSVATEGQGIEPALNAITAFKESGLGRRRVVQNWKFRLRELYQERLSARLSDYELQQAAEKVAARQADPYSIINNWLEEQRS